MLKIVRNNRTAAKFVGFGTSTNPTTWGGADKNAIGYFVSNGSATGTSRGMYLRLYLTGGAGGEAARIFTTNSAAAPVDSINGAHISLSHGTSAGNVTGAANGIRATYHVPHRNLTGTNSVILAELWADNTNSNVTGNAALLRLGLGGNATGLAKLDDTADLMAIDGSAIAAGNIIAAKSAAAISHTARIRINGVIYYVCLSDAQ
jgi:hypothetical protein